MINVKLDKKAKATVSKTLNLGEVMEISTTLSIC